MVRPHIPINLTKRQIEAIQKLEKEFSKAGRHRWADRCRAIILRDKGYGLEETSNIVGRPISTVKGWNKSFRKDGLRSLKPNTSTRGRKRKLGKHERLLLSKVIERGPRSAGFQGSVWTSPMVVEYIKQRWGVKYHPGHVRKLLKKLGFSVQFPREKLALANKEAQEKWMTETYPDIKKTLD
jgi:transposase